MQQLLQQPATGLALTIAAYGVGFWLKSRWPSPLANPLAIGAGLIILLITMTPLTLEQYQSGGALITLFIVPATTALALHIHRQWALLRTHLLPVAAGCLAGSITSMASVVALGRLFGLEHALTASLQPKSVTTAIALELSAVSGGIGPITVAAVIFTGVAGVILGPWLIRLLRLKGSLEIGVALGTSAHAIGTSKAIEFGEVEGAMSGIALVLSGILTSILYVVFV